MKKKRVSFEIILLATILILHAFVAFSSESRLLNWFQTDDAFYYFVTARNIADGKGITFDGISKTNGFHPLWMLICIPVFSLAKINLYLPLRVIVMLLALLNAVTGILLYRFFAKRFSQESGWFVAIFWTFFPTIHELTCQLGLESALTAFALMAALSFLSSFEEHEQNPKRVFQMSLLGAFLLFSRLDTIFIVIFMGLWLVFNKSQLRWQIPLDGLFAFLSAIIAYYLRIQHTSNIFNFLPFLYIFIFLSLISKVVCLYIFKGYVYDSSTPLKNQIFNVIKGLTLSTVFTTVVIFLCHDIFHAFLGFPRTVVVIDFAISLVAMLGWRLFYIFFMKSKKKSYDEDISWVRNRKMWLSTAAYYFGPILILLLAYMLFNKSYAGVAMPISGTIKRWWGTLPLTVYGKPLKTLSEVLGSWFNPSTKDGPWWLLTAPVNSFIDVVAHATGLPQPSQALNNFKRDFGVLVWTLLTILLVWIIYKKKEFMQKAMHETAFLPFFVGCVFHIFSYKATGYLHAKYWYWIPEILCTLLLYGIFLEGILRRYKSFLHGTTVSQFLVATFCLILVLNLGVPIIREYTSKGGDARQHPYILETKFLEENTKPGDIIGMTGGGVIAYFIKDRTIVNLDGLINGAEYFERLKNNTVPEYLDKIGMDYVYAAQSMILESDPYDWIFKGRLYMVGKRSEFELYRYVPGNPSPPGKGL